jgi:hypothetical protein
MDPKVIVKVIINKIIRAATYEQQKHASGSDKTYAVWKCKIINQGSPKSKGNDFDIIILYYKYNNTISMEA